MQCDCHDRKNASWGGIVGLCKLCSCGEVVLVFASEIQALWGHLLSYNSSITCWESRSQPGNILTGKRESLNAVGSSLRKARFVQVWDSHLHCCRHTHIGGVQMPLLGRNDIIAGAGHKSMQIVWGSSNCDPAADSDKTRYIFKFDLRGKAGSWTFAERQLTKIG